MPLGVTEVSSYMDQNVHRAVHWRAVKHHRLKPGFDYYLHSVHYLSINIFYLKTELLREKIRNGKRPGCYKWDILKWHVFPNLTLRLWKQWSPKTWEIPQENSYKEIKCLPEGELVRKAILHSCKYLSNYLIAWNKAQPVVGGTTPWSIMLRYAYVTLI